MSDDLVKRLLSTTTINPDVKLEPPFIQKEAAALIKQLDKACKEWAEVSQKNYQRAKAAEAKLAKAVQALTELVKDCEAEYPPSHGAIKYFCRTTLASLQGDKT